VQHEIAIKGRARFDPSFPLALLELDLKVTEGMGDLDPQDRTLFAAFIKPSNTFEHAPLILNGQFDRNGSLIQLAQGKILHCRSSVSSRGSSACRQLRT
jgi:hypothetical protein